MRVVIFGASGRTGLPLVEQALAAGYAVTAFVRDPAKLPIAHQRLRVVQGDVMDPAAVEDAIKGADAVLSVLGHTRGSPDDVQTVATQNIVNAMNKNGVRRLISLTGAGVRDPKDQPKLIDKVFGVLLGTLQKSVLQDAERHAQVIQNSALDWIIVRGPRLNQGPYTGTYRVGYIGKDSGTQVSRADLAEFMLKQVTDDRFLRTMPVVSY